MTLRALAIALVVIALLAACSGGNEDVVESRPPPSPASRETISGVSDDAASMFRSLHYAPELVDGKSLGAADAPLTLVVFADFQCPFCLEFTLGEETFMVIEYVQAGDLRLEFRHLPILGDESGNAAIASECAADQGKFWEYHRQLFLIQYDAGQLETEQLNVGRFDVDAITAVARDLGLGLDAFDACIRDPATTQRVLDEARTGTTLGLRSTPSFLFQGAPLPDGASLTPRDWQVLFDDALSAP